MPRHGSTSIVVLNQHGDNRGDEAAMVAMVRGLGSRVADPRFTIFDQFADPASRIDLPHPAEYHPIRISPVEYARLVVHAVLRALGVRSARVLGRRGRAMVAAIDEADLVVSAPGGPYFGDLYADHEIAHWLWVWLAHLADKPIGLYATSCGPFRNRLLNPIRRRGYRWFDEVVLRESHSAGMLRDLTGIEATVTTDSAFQDEVPAADRGGLVDDGDALVVVAVRDPGDADRAHHDLVVLGALDALAADAPTTFVFLPQLHGTRHRDRPYLQALANRVRGASSVRVLAEDTTAVEQRAVIAASDLVIAGRYHPAVFAVAAGVPPLVLPYEHKQVGVAEAAGIAEWIRWPGESTVEEVAAAAIELRRRAEEVRSVLATTGPVLRARSAETSELMAGLLGA